MRIARRTLALLTLAVTAATLSVGLVLPAGAQNKAAKKLHDPALRSCNITHQNEALVDILAIRIALAEKDKKAISSFDKSATGAEAALALTFLANSHSRPLAVVDGLDKDNFNKKGKGAYELSFNSFGTYQVDIKLTMKGFKPATDSFKFQVTDTNGGSCRIVG